MKKSVILFLFFNHIFLIQAQEIRVGCIGNSITNSNIYPSVDINSYPIQLRILMGDTYDIQNFGASGRTMLKNGDVPYWNEPAFPAVLDFQPNIATILLGTNDSKPQNWDDYGEAEFTSDYLAMIDTLRSLDSYPEIYLCLPPPAFSTMYSIRDSVIINYIIPKIQQIAEEEELTTIDFYMYFIDKSHLFSDGIHPNIEGLWEITKILYSTLTGNYVQKIQEANIALNKDVLTPISEDSPDKLVDGDRRTIWACPGSEAFTIDLGNADSTDMFQIIFNQSACYQYTIETSNDNSNWDMAIDNSANQDTISFATDSIASTETRYVRFTINSTDESMEYIPLTEIRILKKAPVHAPLITYELTSRTSTRAVFKIDINTSIRSGYLQYFSADNADGNFAAPSAFRFDDKLSMSISILNGNEKYYYAKFYKNNYEIASDTIKLDYAYPPSNIKPEKLHTPDRFILHQNYPNPFNPSTKITYSIPNSDFVVLKIYDILGREIQTLINKFQSSGEYTLSFNSKDLASGIYFYKLQLGNPSRSSGPSFTETKKMVLMR